MITYYLCNKKDKDILYAGELPNVWENITGLDASNIDTLGDLSWAGHSEVGFFNEDGARSLGIAEEQFTNAKNSLVELVRTNIFQEALSRISSIYWRLDNAKEKALLGTGTNTEVMDMLNYIQTLRNIHINQDPFNVVWPDPPPEIL